MGARERGRRAGGESTRYICIISAVAATAALAVAIASLQLFVPTGKIPSTKLWRSRSVWAHMAPKVKVYEIKDKGGRSKRGIMANVVNWRNAEESEQAIRQKLKVLGYQPPRINELLKKTRLVKFPVEAAGGPICGAPRRRDRNFQNIQIN